MPYSTSSAVPSGTPGQALNKARKLAQAQLATLGLQKVGRRTAAMPALIRGNLELISVDDELFFQADQKYMTVRHRNGEVLIEDALKNLETEFTDRLIRIRRNALANILVHQRDRKGRDARFLMIFKGINDRLEIRPSARGGRQKVPKSELSKLGKLSASCNTRARTSSRADQRA
jgi:hypothetical protein